MSNAPKVSVIVPVYNNELYLRECLDSAVNQTLQNIEIICINDGSTDDSLAILNEYALKDSRIHVIDKPNGGYGQTMNMGLAAAKGEYVAFLESDDSINTSAYKRLSEIADEYSLDIVKGDYFLLEGLGEKRILEPVEITKVKERYNIIVNPLDEPWAFYMPMMNCLGLFRREMLEKNLIQHNETPGAAHQDMGFWFQTLCCAQRLMFINEAFYEYRQDNMNASMKSDKTTFSTLDEYHFIESFLQSHTNLIDKALPVFYHRKFGSAMFAYGRAELSLRLPFLIQLSKEFENDLNSGSFCFARFSDAETQQLKSLLKDPNQFYLDSLELNDSANEKRLIEEIASVRLQLQHLQANQKIYKSFETANDTEQGSVDLSFIIPVYNAAQYLSECIASIADSGYQSYEILCINDGSTDQSQEILEGLAERYPQIRIIKQENQGQGAARNRGIALSRGRYIQFVDSDDKLRVGACTKALEMAIHDNLDILFFDGATFYDNPELAKSFASFQTAYKREISHPECVSGVELFKAFKKENSYRVSPCLAVFRRNLFIENGITFPEGVIYEDNAFMLKALCSAKRVAHINEALYDRRIRDGSTMTSKPTAKNARSYFAVYLDMLQFSLKSNWDYATDLLIADELRIIIKCIRSIYGQLDEAERLALRSLPPVQESALDLVIAQCEEQIRREKAERELNKIKKSRLWKAARKVITPIKRFKRKVIHS